MIANRKPKKLNALFLICCFLWIQLFAVVSPEKSWSHIDYIFVGVNLVLDLPCDSSYFGVWFWKVLR